MTAAVRPGPALPGKVPIIAMTRLETLSSDLAAKVQRASAAKQRAAALAACDFAITHAKVEHPLVKQTLQKVRAEGILTPEERAELDALTEQLDEEYFALQEAAEDGGATIADYTRVFGQARAVAALACAGGDDAFQAATEAIYEAAATVDEKEELIDRILSELQP